MDIVLSFEKLNACKFSFILHNSKTIYCVNNEQYFEFSLTIYCLMLHISGNHTVNCSIVLFQLGIFFLFQAKAVAAESNATFFNISAASLTSKYVS